MLDTVISVRDLHKAYGGREAVAGIDLEVQAGEVFAFLGPNGAGKTTTVEILEGYRAPISGEVRVLGSDPRHASRAWRHRVGVVLQESVLPDRESVGRVKLMLVHSAESWYRGRKLRCATRLVCHLHAPRTR